MKTVFLKLTNYCTCFCKHCYLDIKDRKNKYKMDLSKLEFVIQKIKNFFPYEWNVILHGGEILNLDMEYLENAIKILNKNNIKNIGIQTSFIPMFYDMNLKKNFFKLVKKYNLNVSTSVDFNSIRMINGKEEVYLNFMNNIIKEYYNDTGKKIISADVIITKLNIGNEQKIYNYLLEQKNYIEHIDLGIYIPYPIFDKKLYISFKEYSEVLIKFYELDKSQNFALFGDVFIGLKEKFFKKEQNQYYFSCQNCINDYLVIEPNFDVTICIHERIPTGNLLSNSFLEILNHPKRKEWLKIYFQDFEFCNDCEFKNICEVCTVNKNLTLNTMKKKELNKENCPGFYYLLKYIKNDLKDNND